MKELIKPNNFEDCNYESVDSFCELHCSDPPEGGSICNKACRCRTYTNSSILDESELLLF